MKFIILRENLLKPLQKICSILHRNPKLKILNFVLLEIKKDKLFLTGSDLELELISKIELPNNNISTEIAVSAKKLNLIIKELPDNIFLNLKLENNQLIINYKSINFYLSTLPVNNFPKFFNKEKNIIFYIEKKILENMLKLTKFSMGYQDFRSYLNGLLFEIDKGKLKLVASDGYRLAIYTKIINIKIDFISIIIPRKAIIELYNLLLENNIELIKLEINNFNIKILIDNFIFISKLINGKFPDYKKILNNKNDKYLEINRNILKNAFLRISILANEKNKAIKLNISNNKLLLMSFNEENEKAEEIIKINYLFKEIEIIINYNYFIDILKTLKCENIKLFFKDENSLIKIKDCLNNDIQYIIMPIRI